MSQLLNVLLSNVLRTIGKATEGYLDKRQQSNKLKKIRGLSEPDKAGFLVGSAGKGLMDQVVEALNAGVDVDATSSELRNATALNLAAMKGHTEVVRLLIERKANVDKAVYGGFTPLFIASDQGHFEIVRLLLQHGANSEHCSDEDKHTPLYRACSKGHLDVVKLLLVSGADPRHVSEDGTLPIEAARKAGHAQVVSLLLHHAASETSSETQSTNSDEFADTSSAEKIRQQILQERPELRPRAASSEGQSPMEILESIWQTRPELGPRPQRVCQQSPGPINEDLVGEEISAPKTAPETKPPSASHSTSKNDEILEQIRQRPEFGPRRQSVCQQNPGPIKSGTKPGNRELLIEACKTGSVVIGILALFVFAVLWSAQFMTGGNQLSSPPKASPDIYSSPIQTESMAETDWMNKHLKESEEAARDGYYRLQGDTERTRESASIREQNPNYSTPFIPKPSRHTIPDADSGKTVPVSGYTRKDGTPVAPYYRHAPGQAPPSNHKKHK